MREAISKYWTHFTLKFSQALQYRGDMVIFTLNNVAAPVVFLAVWLAVEAGSGGMPYTKSELVKYFVILMVVKAWTTAWSVYFVNADIRDGKLTPFLVRPLSYFADQLFNNIAEKVFKTIYLIPIVIIFSLLFKDVLTFHLPLVTWSIFCISLIMAALLFLVIDMCIGFLAFWTHEVLAIINFYFIFDHIFSGKLVPIDLLPPWLYELANVLPFRFRISLPIEILLERVVGMEMVFAVMIQAVWLAIFALVYRLLWVKGLKKYMAAGA